jgi:molybdate transport system permease protein
VTVWTPLLLTFRIALFATALSAIVALPLARRFSRRGSAAAESFFLLPLVLPPTTLGYYLLLLLGRSSPLGRFLERLGIPLVFDWKGAVIAAACVAFPLFFVTARTALAAVDPRWEDAARLLGASESAVFFRVVVPTAARGLAAAAVLAFARSVGDFGATLLVAGNIPGRTQTLSIAIYDAFAAGDDRRAAALVAVTTVLAYGALFAALSASRGSRA